MWSRSKEHERFESQAQTDARYYRQHFSGMLKAKQLLLLWCGAERLKQRCWLAWGNYIMRQRLLQEEIAEVTALLSRFPVPLAPSVATTCTAVR